MANRVERSMSDEQDDLNKIIEQYSERSKDLQRTLIILIGFGLFFFFMILFPYFSLKYSLTHQVVDDSLVGNISKILILSGEDANISKDIDNELEKIKDTADKEYGLLDNYFAQLENVQAEMRMQNNSIIPNSHLPQRLFLACNAYDFKSKNWLSCNASTMAQRISGDVELALINYGQQLRTAELNSANLNDTLTTIIRPIIQLYSSAPSGVAEIQWNGIKDQLNNTLFRAKNFEYKLGQTVKFVSASKDNLWQLLGAPNNVTRVSLPNEADSLQKSRDLLNEQKTIINNELQKLQTLLEETETPILGKIPIYFKEAIAAFPIALAIGFLTCAYLLGQTIHLRRLLQREYLQKNPTKSFNSVLYPLWIEPFGTKRTWKMIFQFITFSVPVMLFIASVCMISSIMYQKDSIPLFPFAPSVNEIMFWMLFCMGLGLLVLGFYIITAELFKYGRYLRSIRNRPTR